ncbi:MAG: putative UDP-glucose 4-epimerase [Anaerocolumna sp.]|nr:putative UDP-glucose 4-epimerase [Anaerocolumna sp.]
MKRVLVIGANSYIGKKFQDYVLKKIEAEIKVDMITAADGGWRKLELYEYDTILHLAAIVHKKNKKSLETMYDEVNHNLPVELARVAKESGVRQLIFMSTIAVFGDKESCITKNTMPKPVTYYGKSKLAAENDIIKLRNNNFKISIVRPPMVYGEGCKGNYAKLEKLARFTPIFPEYHNKRSIIHIDRLNECIYDLILTNHEGYVHPQDYNYLDTCSEIVKIRKRLNKKTKLLQGFSPQIKFVVNKFRMVSKLFGDLYYEEEVNERKEVYKYNN